MTNEWQEEDKEPSFTLSDFKRWMESQPDDDEASKKHVGMKVESKVGLQKLISKIEPTEGDPHELAKEFKRYGGTVLESRDEGLVVEVDSGSFTIHKSCVRRQR